MSRRHQKSAHGHKRRFVATPARIGAYEALCKADLYGWYVTDALRYVLQKWPEKQGKTPLQSSVSSCSSQQESDILVSCMSLQDQAFARVLAIGVVSTQGVLDDLINKVLSSPEDIDARVRRALQISTYELFFLRKSPHASVNQGVELVRFVAPRACGVANFVLRRLTELLPEFPFGNPNTDFSVALYEQGFPEWLGCVFKDDLGEHEALVLVHEANKPAPLYCMINECKAHPEQVRGVLDRAGVVLEPVPLEMVQKEQEPFVFKDRSQMGHPEVIALIEQGALVISDWSSQQVASLALPDEKPQRFLEIGAGRGTKTIMLQSLALCRYGSQMDLDTVEISAQKNEILRQRAHVAGTQIKHQYVLDAADLSLLKDSAYDVVFIDAPCSGVGTLRRHPEIRWRLKPQDLEDLSRIGLNLLNEASQKVRPGGRLVFATCSCLKAENDEVITAFLSGENGADFTILPFMDKDSTSGKSLDKKVRFFKTPLSAGGPDLHFACALTRQK